MFKLSLGVLLITSQLFIGIDSFKVDSDFLDRVLKVYNADQPCSKQVVIVKEVIVDKEEDSLYDVSKVTLLGETNNGDKENITLQVTEVATDGIKRTLALETGVFEKLYLVYTHVVPKMRDLMKTAEDFSETLFLDLIEANNGSYIVLKTPGFGWTEPTVDMVPDLPDLASALRNLAKWHAMGAVLLEKDQIPKDKFDERLPMKRANLFFKYVLSSFAEVVKNMWGKKWQWLAQQLKDTVPQIEEKTIAIFNRKNESNAFNVFNYGDFYWPAVWLNYGITDAYFADHPIAFKFSSFETFHINTPATDLHHVIYSTPNTKMALKHKDWLIEKVYYPALVRQLSKFGYGGQKLTLDRLKDELRRSELYGMVTCIARVKSEITAKEPIDYAELEEVWTTGKFKGNMTELFHRRFTDAIKPVMEYARDANIFGRKGGNESEEDDSDDSKSKSDSDSD